MTNATTKLSALVAAACLAACVDMNVPDLNNPSVEVLLQRPTRTLTIAAATGLLIGHRVDRGSANGYVAMLGIVGREAYNFDAADARFITEMLASTSLDPGSPRFGGNFWAVPYSNIRNASIVYTAVEKLPTDASGLTAEEKNATLGFAKTIQAMDFLVVINTRDTEGAVVEMSPNFTEIKPIVPKAEVFTHIATLLDQAKTHLQAAGTSFPFPLSSGFAGFDTPASFLKFNRAIKARVEVYRSNWQPALDALAESFLDESGAPDYLDKGVYFAYGSGSGDTLNGLVNPNLFVHPSIVTDADRKPDSSIDDRVTRKIRTVPPRTVQGLTSDKAFTLYPNGLSSIPMIRNEELILLRAEANIGLNNIPDAADDINLIREDSGGLAQRTDLDATNILDELLKQKRYSLLFEGGHRWIDMRRYGRLEQLPKDLPTHRVHAFFPIPIQERDAREQQ